MILRETKFNQNVNSVKNSEFRIKHSLGISAVDMTVDPEKKLKKYQQKVDEYSCR